MYNRNRHKMRCKQNMEFKWSEKAGEENAWLASIECCKRTF